MSLQKMADRVNRARAKLAAAEARADRAERQAEALAKALDVAHEAMRNWFSSEYLDHPLTREVGAALAAYREGK